MYKHNPLNTIISRMLQFALLLACSLSASVLHANSTTEGIIELKLGDYRYIPENIRLLVNRPVILRLTNTDALTPHNFTLEDPADELDVDIDIPAGESVNVQLLPVRPGNYTFYCKNKLLFMDSHREKGMHGILTVVSE